MCRVHREQKSENRTLPDIARELLKDDKSEDGVRGVEYHIHEVMPARVGSEQARVEHMRHPRQRMPIRRVKSSECPVQRSRIYPGGNERIFEDVEVVVKINKCEPQHLPVDQ